MSHRVVWVDIPAVDIERATVFYAAVLDVKIARGISPAFPFGLFEAGHDDVGACVRDLDGDLQPGLKGPLVYLNVEGRLSKAVEAAVAHGGTVLREPEQAGPYGWRALILDSEGNQIALHSPV